MIEAALQRVGAPEAVLGIIIAAVVLMPEGLAAVRAARANRLQTSLNLALGSALASIGLTIPTVALLSLFSWRRRHKIRPVAAADYFERNRFVSWFSKTFFRILPIGKDATHMRPVT